MKTIYEELVSNDMTVDEMEDAITEDVAYRVGKIVRDDLTNDQCNALLSDDPDGFIDNYCEGVGE